MIKATELIYSNPNSEPLRDKKNNLIPFINYSVPAPKRCLDLLLAKYHDRAYQSEVIMQKCNTTALPRLRRPLGASTVLLITDGGLVPAGNPDRIPSSCAKKFGKYSIEGINSLAKDNYEVNHQGYDNSFIEADPNRLLPVDVLRDMEREGIIGKLYDTFLSTVGVMTPAEQSQAIGKKVADYISGLPIDAVIITSACGTSTRCGAYIGLAIEKLGIPVVQVTNLTKIAVGTGLVRVVKGNHVCHPFGSPKCSSKTEYEYRRKLTLQALEMLLEVPEQS